VTITSTATKKNSFYDEEAIREIKDFLISGNQTIAVAESVTAGHLQAAFSTGIDASRFFQGGITAYNIGQKCRHLLVEPTHALSCNCVSLTIAEQMANQVTNIFSSDWGIGITGYASPVDGITSDRLFAYFSISHVGQKIQNGVIETNIKDSIEVQILYVNEVLREMARTIRSHMHT
jgi:PncC family amidohydrolase